MWSVTCPRCRGSLHPIETFLFCEACEVCFDESGETIKADVSASDLPPPLVMQIIVFRSDEIEGKGVLSVSVPIPTPWAEMSEEDQEGAHRAAIGAAVKHVGHSIIIRPAVAITENEQGKVALDVLAPLHWPESR